MFYGEFCHSVDEKGRLFIPARFRSVKKGKEISKFFFTQGLERCLFAYTEEEWNLLQQKISTQSMARRDVRAFSRMLFSRAVDAVCDKQGRVNIPRVLLEYADLKKEVVIVGVLTRFEIWSKESWKKYVDESSKSFEDIAENLVDLNPL
ncbi:MAG: division/cell wall cluster transcriptional repressor MraZ [Candidatus Theseobacter exili]|nr:division/cell wall cluster transcriptional repressor MraZ [Candidatus Theseobacter exili]